MKIHRIYYFWWKQITTSLFFSISGNDQQPKIVAQPQILLHILTKISERQDCLMQREFYSRMHIDELCLVNITL